MTWVEFHDTLAKHPKTLAASEALHISRPTLCGHLAIAWAWAIDHKEDGGPMTPTELAMAAEWPKAPQRFTSALITAGFVDERDGGLWFHDWEDYAGRMVRKRRANRERMRAARGGDVQRTDDAQETHEARTEDERALDVQALPYRTVPNQTDPDPKTTTPQTPQRHKSIDDEFLDGLAREFNMPRTRIDEELEQAQNRKQWDDYRDKRKHFHGWVKRAAGWEADRGNIGGAARSSAPAAPRQNHAGNGRPTGMASNGQGHGFSYGLPPGAIAPD